jgi:carbon storage regulator
MLVLSRKTNETIVIGDNIEVTVCRVGNDRVRLGLRAPKDVHIRRKELPEFSEKDSTSASLALSVW